MAAWGQKGPGVNPRLRRLQADYDDVRETFSGHPHVTVEPLGTGRPPESYRVTYRLRGLALTGEQPEYSEHHQAEIMLPRHYPAEKPYVVPLTTIFHPNIRDYYCIADYWAAGTTLADVIVKLGDMIQWRVYNAASPLDAIAARWATEQEANGLFPIGKVDLGVEDFDVGLKRRADRGSGDAPSISGSPVPALAPVVGVDPQPAGPRHDDDFVVTLRSD